MQMPLPNAGKQTDLIILHEFSQSDNKMAKSLQCCSEFGRMSNFPQTPFCLSTVMNQKEGQIYWAYYSQIRNVSSLRL